MSEETKNIEKEMIDLFRQRAKSLRRKSAVTIGMIILLLMSGIAIFIYAGDIALKEDSRSTTLAYLESAERISLETHTLLTSEILLVQAKEGKLTDKIISDLKDTANNLQVTASILKDVEERPITYQGQSLYVISIATTRIGIVILMLFLVQILVPLYRYHIKLAAFFDARADALMLSGTSFTEIDKLISSFSPDSIDFGKAPVTPTQSTLDLVKETIVSQKSK